ncbi:PilZ domain-containing protein [Leucothrix mucor]|uniref:PilZ domain-containing protein n=1 Tax=Leucothrix mucor TaxID=45248 RepID=UPI0003B68CD1|nr:PilZ domain-containing protein [Leucothrix mucor]
MEIDSQQEEAVRNVINVSIKDKTALHANYMPFIKGGGIYAITDKRFNLGDEVILSLKIMSEAKKYAVPAKVVWVSPNQAMSTQGGVGVQFSGRTKDNVRMALESILGDLAAKPSVYHTY